MLLLLFFGSGALDFTLNYVQNYELGAMSTALFSAIGLGLAGIIGLLILIVKFINGSSKFHFRNVIAGIFLGIPNYFSIYLLIISYSATGWEDSTVHNDPESIRLKALQMGANIITTEDLLEFKLDLIDNIKEILKTGNGQVQEKWLKSNEVRKLLSISPGTLQNLRINGTLPYSKVGGVIYYDYDEIQGVLDQNRIHNNY
jgi:hypothetical protein